MPVWILLAVLLVVSPLLAVESAAAAAEPLSVAALLDLIVQSEDAATAGQALVERYALAPAQVQRVLALDLARLAALDAVGLADLLAAEGGSGGSIALDLTTKRMRAAEGMVLPVQPGEAGHLAGDVRFELERVVIEAERIDFQLASIPGGGPLLERAEFHAGAAQPRLRVDTRESRLVHLAFRGLLSPQAMTLVRREHASGAGELVFDLDLSGLGDFSGRLRDADGNWLPVVGNAERMAMVITVDVVAGSISAPRITDLRLAGSGALAATITIEEPRQAVTVRSTEIRLRFGPDGGLQRVEGGRDSEVTGRPHGAGLPTAVAE